MEDYEESQSKLLLPAQLLETSEKQRRSKTYVENKGHFCCFSAGTSKKQQRRSVQNPDESSISFIQHDKFTIIFDQVIPPIISEVPWVSSLIKKSIKVVMAATEKIKHIQNEFKQKSAIIYQTKQEFGIKIRKSEDEEYEEKLKKSNMIHSKLTDIQQTIFDEIESQVQQKSHPVQMLNHEFQKGFIKNYHKFVNKKMIPENEQLLENIIKQTVGLQSQYVFKMAEKISKEEDRKIEEELQRKKEITVANQALDEVKAFHQVLYILTMRIYYEGVKANDMDQLNEDIYRILIDTMFCNEIYNILVFLMRIDNFDSDKDMRQKYQILKSINAKTQDFGINPYLCLNDPIVLVEELSKLSGVIIETDRDLLQNPTVQNIELEEFENIEFKEYLKSNMEHINQLPTNLQQIILQKSRVRPYKKSVERFRTILIKPCSPLKKLFQLQEFLQTFIPSEVQEFWKDSIKNGSNLQINREEYISLMLFIISKAQVPDLLTQLKFIKEFTSEDIQNSEQNFTISNTYMQVYSTVKWISSLDKSKLYDKSYLLKANVLIKEEEETVRYDKIKFQEENDRYDPFSVEGGSFLEKNSYIDNKTFVQPHKSSRIFSNNPYDNILKSNVNETKTKNGFLNY
eukprot:403349353